MGDPVIALFLSFEISHVTSEIMGAVLYSDQSVLLIQSGLGCYGDSRAAWIDLRKVNSAPSLSVSELWVFFWIFKKTLLFFS